MNIATIIALIVVLALFIPAARYLYKYGSCPDHGSCSGYCNRDAPYLLRKHASIARAILDSATQNESALCADSRLRCNRELTWRRYFVTIWQKHSLHNISTITTPIILT